MPQTFDEWWRKYDPDDVNMLADKRMAEGVWFGAMLAAEQIARETLITVPFTGDHDRTNFGAAIAKQMAEAIADRIAKAA